MIDAEVARTFLRKDVGVVYTDSQKDYILKGNLIALSAHSIILQHQIHGKCTVALEAVKKIFEISDEHAGQKESA